MTAPSTTWKETPAPDEATRFEDYARSLTALQDRRARDGKKGRALHAKPHGLVAAEFTVLDGLPEHARVGLFKTPRTFKAWVRFSNGQGARQADAKPDVRGVAIKVMGVDGKKIIPGLEDARTQDFLLINTPATSFQDAAQFMTFATAMANPATALFKLLGGFGVGKTVKLAKSLAATFRIPVTSMATQRFWSAAPIKFGPYAVHYGLRPVAAPPAGDSPSENRLAEDLATRLKSTPLVYDFMVQFYVDDVKTPIEDASVEWKEMDAPFLTVARLTLPAQDVTSEVAQKHRTFGEALSFDPWHATEDFRPLGDLMRARAVAYKHSVINRQAAAEPTGDETF